MFLQLSSSLLTNFSLLLDHQRYTARTVAGGPETVGKMPAQVGD